MADMPKLTPADMPPPSFQILVSMFSTQAAVALGMIENPLTKKKTVELHLAKHFIGMLTILEEKTKGNLSTEEAEFLERSLHSLRMGFLQADNNAK